MSVELPETITVHDEPLKTTDFFTYQHHYKHQLCRSGRGKEDPWAYGALQKRLWSCHDINTKIKMKVYSVAVIPCLLYSTECTTFYRRYIMALTRVQPRHLRYILNIKWRDRVPDVEVLRRAHTVSVEALVTVARVRWAGRVQQMASNRLPKAVFYSELSQGKRSHGGQKLRFEDVLKRHMKKTGISHDTWEEEAGQRVEWRGLLRKATSAVEEQCQQEYQRAHARRHSAATSSNFLQQLSALLQIQSGSDCPHESLFKIGLNSNTSQSFSATDSHY